MVHARSNPKPGLWGAFYLLLRVFILMMGADSLSAQSLTSSVNAVEIHNDHLNKRFSFQSNQPSPIHVEVVALSAAGEELLTNAELPLFEFVIDQQVVRATDPLWTYRRHSERALANGGREFTLEFVGAADPVDGLELVLHQQIFADSTLIREKLVLRAQGLAEFPLHRWKGEPHFKFPQYQLIRDGEAVATSTEVRLASWEAEPVAFRRPGQEAEPVFNHMFHPQVVRRELGDPAAQSIKGPVQILDIGSRYWLTAYEHGGQDDARGLLSKDPDAAKTGLVDARQGIDGVFDFSPQNEDFWFLAVHNQSRESSVDIGVAVLRGGYFDGEIIDAAHPYESVWTASGFGSRAAEDSGRAMLWDYLTNRICEHPASRRPEFYYNTWGMQRAQPREQLRASLTYERIFAEIRRAADLGVEVFVLDDGWEQAQGVWTAHAERLPDGLEPIRQELDRHNMKLGVWFSPLGIDPSADRYRDHPEWVVRDSRGDPVKAQWGLPAFDFVSDFRDVFVEDCKKLIDQGVRFFKWDAINSVNSSLPGLHHGSAEHSEAERRARYEYLLPLYVTEAMRELVAYEPELVIEIDLTEARRSVPGLAVLSQGKYFWMNNGASWYGDYTDFRAKSMRSIPNLFAGIVPIDLFTYANYPHDSEGFGTYNTLSSLVSGYGFWGDLSLTTDAERQAAGIFVRHARRVLPALKQTEMKVVGRVGDSPEVYTRVDPERAVGQVVVFSEEPGVFPQHVAVKSSGLLGVVGRPFRVEGEAVSLDFGLDRPTSAQAAFLLPGKFGEARLAASTVALAALEVEDTRLSYTVMEPGRQDVLWPVGWGRPEIAQGAPAEILASIEEDGFYRLKVAVNVSGIAVEIAGQPK